MFGMHANNFSFGSITYICSPFPVCLGNICGKEHGLVFQLCSIVFLIFSNRDWCVDIFFEVVESVMGSVRRKRTVSSFLYSMPNLPLLNKQPFSSLLINPCSVSGGRSKNNSIAMVGECVGMVVVLPKHAFLQSFFFIPRESLGYDRSSHHRIYPSDCLWIYTLGHVPTSLSRDFELYLWPCIFTNTILPEWNSVWIISIVTKLLTRQQEKSSGA